MSLESAIATLKDKAALAPPLGHRIKIDLGDDGVILWDGTGPTPIVNNEPGEAETTIIISLTDAEELIAGTLNATMAYMTGRLKIEGSMGVAMKIGQLLGD